MMFITSMTGFLVIRQGDKAVVKKSKTMMLSPLIVAFLHLNRVRKLRMVIGLQ